jgi:fumarate reductase flavoprotein subunit
MGGVRTADTIEELAALQGIDAAALAATLAAYNRAARGEAADAFTRTAFGLAPLAPPFAVTRVNAALFHTQGGLQVDHRARVVRPDGTPIPNLFAGGGAAVGQSGVAGGAGYVSGNGLLTATVLGYVAGESAAEEIRPANSLHSSVA